MMAVHLDQNVKDDLKTQFVTREGTYRLMTLSEYSRPNRVGYTNNQSSPQVRVSIVSLPNEHEENTFGNVGISTSIESRLSIPMHGDPGNITGNPYGGDRICFNFGKELYVYSFRGVKKGSELSKPIDKKLYKGTNPSCHDFNSVNANPEGAQLLVGFTTGQIQLVQPGRREPGKLYNEQRLIDKTKVTCLKWLPGSPNLFLASHSSGHLYLYNEELSCTPTIPNYQPFKIGDGYTIFTCKSKSTRNPLYKWVFGTDNCSINEFCFSPCGSNLAIVSQDGFLRVFHYDTMELLGIARSYFGGFLCVCWSPDGKYIVVGGEDDLVTVWSLNERRVVARGQGHRSWVSVVAFDPYTTSYTNWNSPDFSDDENPNGDYRCCANDNNHDTNNIEKTSNLRRPNSESFHENMTQDKLATSYRLGSVSQDTQLCLWDITEDILRHPLTLRQRVNSTNECTIQQNGDIGNDIKIIKPIAIGNTCTNDDISHNNSSKNSTNSSSSKFSTANCTISSANDSENRITNTDTLNNKQTNSNNKQISIGKQNNCINVVNNINKNDYTIQQVTSTNSKISARGLRGSSEGPGISAFNTLTQRLSNFSFGSGKKSTESQNYGRQNHHRKTFSLSKSSGNHHSFILHNNITHSPNEGNSSMSSLKNSKSSQSSVTSSYDPMKLIGTPVCPRFDECSLLEPLVCKKIAHERLTALIFREDCFLTACQDGFIYTWARPNFSNVPQHMSASPSAPSGGTVV